MLTNNGIDYICQKFGDINECVVSAGLSWSYLDIEGTTHTETGATSSVVSRLIFAQLVVSVTMTSPARGTFTYSQLRAANGGNDVTLVDCETLDGHDENSGDQWCYTTPVQCTNPIGNEGDIDSCGDGGTNQPDTTHKYKCVSGSWIDQGFNPICTAVNCSNPFGEDGQTIPCGDGGTNQPLTDHSYKCVNGGWIDQGFNPDCGAMLCSEHTDPTLCVDAGCYWYKKFIWEQESCHNKPLDPMEQYLVYGGIAASGIALIILLTRR